MKVLEGCSACQIEDLLDAIDTLWGIMPAEQVHEIREECPGLAELCRHAHHRMSHEQRVVHIPLWAEGRDRSR